MNEYPFWLDTLGAPEAASLRSPGPLPAKVDVVIVGAGYTGLAAARVLARAGASVLVLEREHIGFGASSRNAGQVLTGLRLDPATLVRRYGAPRAAELGGIANDSMTRLEALITEERIDCEYQRCGHIEAAWKAKHVRALAEEQEVLARVFGREVSLVSRADQRSEIGSDVYHGLLVDERSGALNPARYVYGLAAAARRAGACIVTGIGVQHIERTSLGWRVLATGTRRDIGKDNDRFETCARDVMVATNGYTDASMPALRRRVISIGSYIIVTEPLGPDRAREILPRNRTVFDTKHFLYYFRRTADHRLLFGGRAELSRPTAASTSRAAAILRAGMIAVFPRLASIGVAYAWGGHVAFTSDEMPHAGIIDGLHYACGYCGHGVAMSTYLGELVARRIAGQPVTNLLIDASFPSPPLGAGARWLLPIAGAYYKWRDLVG